MSSIIIEPEPEHRYHRVIRPPGRGINLNLPELWAYRELLFYLAWREVKIRYKQTVIGAGWGPYLTISREGWQVLGKRRTQCLY